MKHASELIGVTPETIRFWEGDRTMPWLAARPALYEYLGFCPADPGASLGKRIVLWREACGVTQQALARQVGIDPGSLARVERGVGGLAAHVVAAAVRTFEVELGTGD